MSYYIYILKRITKALEYSIKRTQIHRRTQLMSPTLVCLRSNLKVTNTCLLVKHCSVGGRSENWKCRRQGTGSLMPESRVRIAFTSWCDIVDCPQNDEVPFELPYLLFFPLCVCFFFLWYWRSYRGGPGWEKGRSGEWERGEGGRREGREKHPPRRQSSDNLPKFRRKGGGRWWWKWGLRRRRRRSRSSSRRSRWRRTTRNGKTHTHRI